MPPAFRFKELDTQSAPRERGLYFHQHSSHQVQIPFFINKSIHNLFPDRTTMFYSAACAKEVAHTTTTTENIRTHPPKTSQIPSGGGRPHRTSVSEQSTHQFSLPRLIRNRREAIGMGGKGSLVFSIALRTVSLFVSRFRFHTLANHPVFLDWFNRLSASCGVLAVTCSI